MRYEKYDRYTSDPDRHPELDVNKASGDTLIMIINLSRFTNCLTKHLQSAEVSWPCRLFQDGHIHSRIETDSRCAIPDSIRCGGDGRKSSIQASIISRRK